MINEFIERIVIERNKNVDNAVLIEIQEIAKENGIETKFILNEKAIVNALEKQMPKKIIVEKYDIGGNDYFCPCCSEVSKGRYCSNCGQALDWSENNG